MLAPVNRSSRQSRPPMRNPVRVEMPRRHANWSTIAVNSLSSASVGDLLIEAVTAGWGHDDRLLGVEGGLHNGGVQALQA